MKSCTIPSSIFLSLLSMEVSGIHESVKVCSIVSFTQYRLDGIIIAILHKSKVIVLLFICIKISYSLHLHQDSEYLSKWEVKI